jgi:S-adenosylmethionine:tRNA ribosyltransferase-isomerase
VDIADFDYDLPTASIAQEPLPERDASRLLVLDRVTGARTDRSIRDLPGLLSAGDLLVTNRSRVIPARLRGTRPSGGAAEILLVRSHGGGAWDALVKPGRQLRAGTQVAIAPELSATIRGPSPESPAGQPPLRRVQLRSSEANLDEVLERVGRVPLPPYIKREASAADRDRYQTVYAREAGSVAAPTAGLHLSARLLDELARKGIERAEVLLHVGPGTFQPVKASRIEDHVVAPEAFRLPEETAAAVARVRARGGRVIAVGTTTTRVLESCGQPGGTVRAAEGSTDLAIVPGFPFRVIDGLLTNFHLPRSSLLLLVAAFAGRGPVLDAYAAAVAKGYRFYSYGDAMLIRPAPRS